MTGSVSSRSPRGPRSHGEERLEMVGFIAGVFIGVWVGVIMIALMIAAKRGDEGSDSDLWEDQ